MDNRGDWHAGPGREGQGYYGGSKLRPKSFVRRNLWAIISTCLVVVLLGVLYFVLSRPAPATNAVQQSSSPKSGLATTVPGTAAASAPTQAPTQAASVAPGTVLCQYDATSGFQNWVKSPQWKQVNDGTLGSAGTDDGNGANSYITWSDCKLATGNYAVEAQIQIVRSTDNNGYYESGIMIRGDGNRSGYQVGVGAYNQYCSQPPLAMVSLVQDDRTGETRCYSGGLAPLPGAGASQNYQVDTNFHTYRAEVTGNTIRLFIDGRKLLETTDNTFTDAGQVGLRDVNADLNVKSFKVTAL
ncbi:DUF1080 domain-containing protein [Ktedonosporobacter rubrisoli]|uniref:DUF1080 domain-containing protein n=1 Tax=Ktedonosporobacter rubrisoli TaxID=2509675 RepID=A0A4P6K1U5_KTERU|nr:family 16 glycoside hydrolase [Ktedonosporobacter rubrisoli]QBD81955.1 DUF1080 domain-containing protein [Ktedonosporobacter rubrisoli]